MKKQFTKILCLILAVMFVVGLFGCGTKETTETTKTTDSTAQQTEAKQKIDPYMKYSPPITMTTAFKIEETSDSVKFVEGENAENNVVRKMFEDFMGIKITNKILCPPSAVKDKMQLAIASNDIPDCALVDQTMLLQLTKGDMVENMADYYNKYASDNLKSVLGQNNNVLFQPSTIKGKIMALPDPTTIYDSMPVVWVRKDWRERLNIPLPETMEDLFEMAKAFAEKDPDGNGKNDTLGLYMKNDIDNVKYIMNAYGVYPNIRSTNSMTWLKDSKGNYYNGSTDPKAKTVLSKLNELYKAGAIDKEFAIKDTSKAIQSVAGGKVGIYFSYFSAPIGSMNTCHKNVPGSDWEAISVPPAEGMTEMVPGVPLNVYGYLYVRKGYEHPEALVVMLNHLCDGYGATWLNKNGSTEFEKRYNEIANDPKYSSKSLNQWMPFQLSGNKNWGPDFKAAVDAGKTTLAGKQADYSRVIQTDPVEAWPWKKVYLEGFMKAEYKNVKYSDYNGAATETWQKTKSMLDKEELESYVAYIMGAKPISDFDDFVKRYNNLGATKIAEEIKNLEN